MKNFVLVALLSIAVNTLTLVSPRPLAGEASRYCASIHEIGGPFHLVVNCDSSTFTTIAHQPGLMFTAEHKLWQSRPLYAVLGYLMASLPTPLSDLLGISQEHAAFVLLNWVLLTCAVFLLLCLLGPPSDAPVLSLIVPITMFAANDVTKAFFWTPHLQLFNVFVPIFSLYLFQQGTKRIQHSSRLAVAALGAGLGILCLAYGAFAVTVGGFFVLCSHRREWAKATLAVACCCAAPLLWIAFVTSSTGGFYSHEIATYRQFVWILDSIRVGAFGQRLSENLLAFLQTLQPTLAIAVAPVAIAYGTAKGRGLPSIDEPTRLAFAYYLIAAIPFYALMGFYSSRLTWTFATILLSWAALELQRLHAAFTPEQRRNLAVGGCLISIAYLAFWTSKHGPYD